MADARIAAVAAGQQFWVYADVGDAAVPTIDYVSNGGDNDVIGGSDGFGVGVVGTDLTNPTTVALTGGYVSAARSGGGVYDYSEAPTVLSVLIPHVSSGTYSLVMTNSVGSSAPHSVVSNGTENGGPLAPSLVALTVSPTSGPAGTKVNIIGDSLTEDVAIVFDTTEVPLDSWGDEQHVTFYTPEHAVGPVSLKAKNNDGTSNTLAAAFTVT